ncbi:lysine N(6)-hydroxylase/L-ornithine N(5)-oxygenase family protein [Cupriavidus taiwanensis]|uniref:L-ornithine N-monooxygenase(L-ornithine N5-oxygenase) Siderophore biosynthesis protein n=1 Tax=Cupriavidus taiwanensis TaxID=164546 RepID=A0A375CB45_9BURK|nr:L-ornithine N-monooxygenase(L-ornithine N5-oxygenase) Siderophore biosynthesis protein [Cupriavidus taiwanensis]
MTLREISPAAHDLIGIGFGPSNLALAIALQEQAAAGRALDAHFIEKQRDYQWHGNTLVAQSEMQISFLKDLVSLRNPTSPYSFINYLHRHGRLVDFINLRTFYPSRMEYNDYLRWAASHFAAQCSHGEEVARIEPVAEDGRIGRVRVVTVDAQGREHTRLARAVVLSTGGTPRIPEAFAGLRGDPRLTHHSGYLGWIGTQPCASGKPMRIAVIGAGQSAAEAFIDLHDNYPSVKVDWIIRGAALKPADDSPFVNEIFAPAYTDVVFEQAQAGRDRLIEEYLNTNYSVIDANLIDQIYAMLYRQKVSGQFRANLLTCKAVQAAHAGAGGIELAIGATAPGAPADTDTRRYDAVVLATGYERESHRRLLAPLARYLGDYRVDRNYRVQAAPELAVPVYLQGFCQSSHGLSDTLLSVLPARAEEIASDIHDALAGERRWMAQAAQAGGTQAIAAA